VPNERLSESIALLKRGESASRTNVVRQFTADIIVECLVGQPGKKVSRKSSETVLRCQFPEFDPNIVSGWPRQGAIAFDIVDKLPCFSCSDALMIRFGAKEQSLKSALDENHPAIRFTDGAFMQGMELAEPTEIEKTDFDPATIQAINWSGIDLKSESQGPARNQATVQGRVIQILMAGSDAPEVVFDGDVSGEIADVVTLRRQGRVLDVHLYHCKYMQGEAPGARISELYEVCGQAMKSVRWANPNSIFLKRMLQQEERRLSAGQTSRFMRGDRYMLEGWLAERGEFRTRFNVTIAQPGYAKSKADPAHMPLLGSLKGYLMSTYGIGLVPVRPRPPWHEATTPG
jgi:hypothetical protein